MINDNLYNQILRQQRGYPPLPHAAINTVAEHSGRGKYTSKRNPCPICQKSKGCKIFDNNLTICLRADKTWSVPGYRYVKDARNGMGSVWVLDNGQNHNYRPQQVKPKTSNIIPLTDEQLDYEARLILKQLSLRDNHAQRLIGLGLTDKQIKSINFKSVESYQEFNLAPISSNFPGIINGKLSNKNSGFLIPIRSQKGLIIGFQIANDIRNPKYQHLTGCSERRVSGELPLQFFKSNDSRELNIIEGTLKPLTAATLHDINVLGAGGVIWHSSESEFKDIIKSKEFDLYILNPDTGSKHNHHVMSAYRSLYEFLKKLGVTLYVRDWGQGEKTKSDKIDVDEISTETFNSAKIVSYKEWDNQVLANGEISQEKWFERFKIPGFNQGLIQIIKRIYEQIKPKNKPSYTVHLGFGKKPDVKNVIVPNNTVTAMVRWQPEPLTAVSYTPGLLPTFEEWKSYGSPKIIIHHSERLDFYNEAYEKGFKHLLDSTPTGHGKSYDAGRINLGTFGIDPNNTDNKTRIFYLSPDHRNPTNATVEANYVDLEARHDGLVYDHSRTTALGKPHVVRANKNQHPDIPSNCPENQTFLTVAELGLPVFGGKDSGICQSCPLLNQCPFLDSRHNTLKNERLIRADINSIPNPSGEDILIIDDVNIVNTRQIKIAIDEILKTVGKLHLRNDDRIFKILRPILVAIYKGLESIKSDKYKYGISHDEVMKLLPTFDELKALIWEYYADDWLKAKDVWGTPIWDYEMINGVPEAVKIIGYDWVAPSIDDLINECYKLIENFAKFISGIQTPQEKQEAIKLNVIPVWLPILISSIAGKKNINLRIDNGTLTITSLSKRHRNIIKNAGFSILLDATQSKHDYALSLGVSPDEILEVSEVKQDVKNLTIHIVKGVGKGSKQRRETMQERITAAITGISKLYQGLNIGLIDHKSAMAEYKSLLMKLGYWYRDTRGSNQFLNTQTLVSVGCPTPNLGQMAAEYQTLTGRIQSPDKITGDYGEWVKRKIIAELIQCVGRLRAHLRPGEELHHYIVADLDDSLISAIRLAYPTAKVTIDDVYDIAPEAASKGTQTERGIIQTLYSLMQSGSKGTIEEVADKQGITKGGVSKCLSERLGMGFRALKKCLLLLLEAINNKSKLSVLEQDSLFIAKEYLPNVVKDLEDGQIDHADVVTEIITTSEAFGEREFKEILAQTPIPTLCKLLGAVLQLMPDDVKKSVLIFQSSQLIEI